MLSTDKQILGSKIAYEQNAAGTSRRHEIAYMRHMVVELEVVEKYGMFGVIELDKVLKCPSLLVPPCFNIVDFYGIDIDGNP